MEATCQVDKLDTRIGADGKARPTTYAKRAAPAEGEGDGEVSIPTPDGEGEGGAIDRETSRPVMYADALAIADEAIFKLTSISKRAKQRTEAFEKVIHYCKKQLRKG